MEKILAVDNAPYLRCMKMFLTMIILIRELAQIYKYNLCLCPLVFADANYLVSLDMSKLSVILCVLEHNSGLCCSIDHK